MNDANTRAQFRELCARVAELNGVADVGQMFTVAPNPAQKMVDALAASSSFLKLINNPMVIDIVGKKIFSMPRLLTKSGGTLYEPIVLGTPNPAQEYRLYETYYNVVISYGLLDTWAGTNFQKNVKSFSAQARAIDRIKIGFNGTHRADNSDPQTNPMLHIGWLEQLRQGRPEGVMSGVSVGSKAHYRNLDALVFDAKNTLIDAPYKQNPEMVAIVGNALLSDKYFPMMVNSIFTAQKLGGLRVLEAPYFPSNAIFLTPLNNLSIYTQRGSILMALRDEPNLDCIVEYCSLNEGYVVEDLRACALIENITLDYDAFENC